VRLQALADLFQPQLARVAVVGRRADLDELVRPERAVDLRQHLVGEALLVAYDHDRRERVRLRAQLASSR